MSFPPSPAGSYINLRNYEFAFLDIANITRLTVDLKLILKITNIFIKL